MLHASLRMIITISKGQQITIPSKIREELDLKEGTRLELNRKGNAIISETPSHSRAVGLHLKV